MLWKIKELLTNVYVYNISLYIRYVLSAGEIYPANSKGNIVRVTQRGVVTITIKTTRSEGRLFLKKKNKKKINEKQKNNKRNC